VDAERREELRHAPADRAEPDQPHGLPLDLDELRPRPLGRPGLAVHGGDPPGDGEHQSDRVLGDGMGVDPRRVGDRHSAGPAGGEVDVVGSGPPDGDQAETGARGQDVVSELRVSADVDDDLRVADAADELRLLVRAALGVHGDIAQLPQSRLGGGAGEGSREVVGDHDLETHRRSSLW